MQFSLRSSFMAHASDVRSLGTMDDCIISGSMDRSMKQWTEVGVDYEETMVMGSHPSFIGAVCYIQPFGSFDFGLILCGGHDNRIVGYLPYTSEEKVVLIGHTGPVCSLSQTDTAGYLLSASWDGTAKLWDVASGACVTTYKGHSKGLWDVISMPGKRVVTCSGDKLIKVFAEDGQVIRTLGGHTESVRGLACYGPDSFLSCSNDGSVRKWVITLGTNDVLTRHDTNLYCIAVKGNLIAYGGEKHFTIWTSEDKKDRQEIKFPTSSVWTITILQNKDVVAGTSDGYIRIFTMDSTRTASSLELAKFEREFLRENKLESYEMKESSSNVDYAVKEDDVPGKEALSIKGLFDGEIKIIEDGGKRYCYTWSLKNKSWSILEDDKPPKVPVTKQLFEGQEYDYVFTVEIDGCAPLKLPYNKGDDPALVAHGFIIHNNLSITFLDRIVAFLRKNSGEDILNETSTSTFKPGEDFAFEPRNYYPPNKHVTFEQHELKLICKKAENFMMEMDFTDQERENVIVNLLNLVTNSGEYDRDYALDVLITAIAQWPDSLVYPIMDIARIVTLNRELHPLLFNEENASRLFSSLDRFMSQEALMINRMFLFRIFSNMFSGEAGEKIMFAQIEYILPKLADLVSDAHKGLQVAAATFILNMSLTSLNKRSPHACRLCHAFIDQIYMLATDSEAIFRLLVALGTVGILEGTDIMNNGLLTFVQKAYFAKGEDPSVLNASKCAGEILHDYMPPNN